MIKNIVFISCCLISIPLFAQNDWGYCVTKVRYTDATDSIVADTLFISKVINLATLNCDFKVENIRKNKIYSNCIRDWFYMRIGESHKPALSFISKDDFFVDIELYPDFPGSKQYHLAIPGKEKQSIFMDKKMAVKRRSNWIKLAKHNKSIMVLVK